MNDRQQSEFLETFLNWIADVPKVVARAEDQLHRAEDEETDLNHFLELMSPDRTEVYRAARKLQTVLQDRREAKDILDALAPIAEWISANAGVINKMKNVLGEIRKTEQKQQNRLYREKTDVLETVRRNHTEGDEDGKQDGSIHE